MINKNKKGKVFYYDIFYWFSGRSHILNYRKEDNEGTANKAEKR